MLVFPGFGISLGDWAQPYLPPCLAGFQVVPFILVLKGRVGRVILKESGHSCVVLTKTEWGYLQIQCIGFPPNKCRYGSMVWSIMPRKRGHSRRVRGKRGKSNCG